jgi:Kdo2-lipid IVA lauroyltransferase/acyltransferase
VATPNICAAIFKKFAGQTMSKRHNWEIPAWQRHVKHTIEALGIYSIFLVFKLLPLDAASWLGGALMRAIGPHTQFHQRAVQNLQLVYGAQHPVNLSAMWDNLGRTFAEMPHLNTLFKKNRVACFGLEHLHNAATNGHGAIFVSSHSANWEVLALATWAHGYPLSAVYRRPNNPAVDWLLRRMRKQVTPNLIPKGAQGARHFAMPEATWFCRLVG